MPDAADASDAGFSPSMLSGLVLWLDANRGVTETDGRVVAWADQSSYKNNAAAPADVDGQPFRVQAAVHDLPAIRFGFAPSDADAGPFEDGGQHTPLTTYLVVLDAPSLQFGTGDFVVETVIRVEHPAFGAVFEKQLTTNPYAGVGMFANAGAGSYGGQIDANHFVLTSLMNDYGKWRLYALARHGSVVTVRIDGAVAAQMDFADAGDDDAAVAINSSAAGRDLTIGAQVKNTTKLFDLGADLAEIIAVIGPLPAKDLTALEQYLETKYAIP
jgi:hypothetical protein